MSRRLVTLQQASDHVRRDTTDDDSDLALKIDAASEAVISYLGAKATFIDSSGNVPVNSSGAPVGVPANVQIATLIIVAELYKNREGQPENMVDAPHGYAYLNRAAVSLLYPLRDPALS